VLRRMAFAAAVVAIVIGCGSSATPAVSDPKEIVTKAVTATQSLKAAHVKIDLSGTVPFSFGGASGSSLTLDGTTVEGDVDVAGRAAHLSFAVPALLGTTGEFTVVNQAVYMKISLTGPKWSRLADTGGTGMLPLPSGSPGAVTDELNTFLARPEVAPKKLGDEKCGDKDCYKVELTLPVGDLAGSLGGALSSFAPLPSLGTTQATLDLWVEKDSFRPAKATVAVDMGTTGKLTVAVALSKFDQAVTIAPPPADQIDPSGGLFQGLPGIPGFPMPSFPAP